MFFKYVPMFFCFYNKVILFMVKFFICTKLINNFVSVAMNSASVLISSYLP